MGLGNIGWFQILVVLVIVLLVFGTKRIRHLGSDLGGAIREFRKGVSDDDSSGKSNDGSAWDQASDGDSATSDASRK
ncbi:MAG: twin-arginine translocase TatA/TatE family subunit [Wenzhouxiangella sp.]|jgi:sec-independent protein translocase protein TatA|nr:twin-arginine translocase TatA/TatE family subunit [Wenzhouxiangella sp.]